MRQLFRVLCLLSVTSSAYAAELPVERTTPVVMEDGYTRITSANGITFDFKTHDDVMDARVICDTTGWVSVGFDPVEMMMGANFIIGYIDLESKALVRDDFGIDKTHHKADTALGGVDNVTNAAGMADATNTMISFTIPLDSKDAYDKPLTLGRKHKVILGCGKDGFKNFVAGHKKIAVTEIQL